MSRLATKSKTKLRTEIDPRERVVTLYRENEVNLFNICLHLYDIYNQQLYKSWGFDSFKSYIENDLTEFGVDYRIAMYRVGIGRVIREYKLDESLINDVSYTKLKELITLIKPDSTAEEVIKLIKDNSNKSFREIQTLVKNTKMVSPNAYELTKVTLSFTADQREVFDRAISIGKDILSTDNPSLIIDYILIDWLLNINEDKKSIDERVMDEVRKLRRNMEV